MQNEVFVYLFVVFLFTALSLFAWAIVRFQRKRQLRRWLRDMRIASAFVPPRRLVTLAEQEYADEQIIVAVHKDLLRGFTQDYWDEESDHDGI